jgi:hypothetical protein
VRLKIKTLIKKITILSIIFWATLLCVENLWRVNIEKFEIEPAIFGYANGHMDEPISMTTSIRFINARLEKEKKSGMRYLVYQSREQRKIIIEFVNGDSDRLSDKRDLINKVLSELNLNIWEGKFGSRISKKRLTSYREFNVKSHTYQQRINAFNSPKKLVDFIIMYFIGVAIIFLDYKLNPKYK